MFKNEYKEKYSDTYYTPETVSAVQIQHVENPEKQTYLSKMKLILHCVMRTSYIRLKSVQMCYQLRHDTTTFN